MPAIIDARTNPKAIENLKTIAGNVFEFNSEKVTYDSVLGHPDIFLFQDQNKIIAAPNSPEKLFRFLESEKIDFEIGNSPVGKTLENSTLYNCLCNEKYFFHKKNFTDSSILKYVEDKTFVNLPQAYTACSLIGLDENRFITSDKGIEKVLENSGFTCFYFNPEKIAIHGHRNGFIGGTCGILEHRIFFNGNIERHSDGKKLKEFILSADFEPIYLHNDFLYDGGRIFFV
jgi:hypothetical protein